jgi:hypothetical protein
MASLVHDGHRMTVTWPGRPLPPPSISGDSATYAEVLPGADLVVRRPLVHAGHR